MIIRATILEMASSEIMEHIPSNVYQDIKKKDPHPVFRAYVVGHEGESTGKVVGAGNMVKRWFASAINKIVDKLQYGIKIFHEHAETNVHEGRVAIGHIVGKAKKIINDNISAIAIAYIKPEFRNLPLDVASIEADIVLSGDPSSGIFDANVEDITGVALGNSAVNRPGFPGATLLSQVQEFVSQSQFNTGGGDMGITISEVKNFIKAEGLMPSDLFGIGDLTKDPTIEGHIDKMEEKFEKSLITRKKRINEGFDETKDGLIKEHEEKIKEKDGMILKLTTDNIKSNTGRWLEVQKEKRELSEEQMKYITLKLPKFKPEELEKAEDEFSKFLDDKVDELKSIEKDVFGKEPETKEKSPGGETKHKKAGDDFVEDMALED